MTFVFGSSRLFRFPVHERKAGVRCFGEMISLVLLSLLVISITSVSTDAQTYTVLHNFTGASDGGNPYAGLTIDQAGNLYGTTLYGGYDCGAYGTCGTTFRLKHAGSGWVFNPLYNFQGGNDGANPFARVIIGPNGGLYGTTWDGGGSMACNPPGCGTVFNLRPAAHASPNVFAGWTEAVLYPFTYPATDGAFPGPADLVFDQAGNLYGTTVYGGLYEITCGGGSTCGTVYRLMPSSGGGWTHSILYSFTGGNDGNFPYSGVIFDKAGNLYGTATAGGAYGALSGGYGTVYQLTPSGSGWDENTLYIFQGGGDGSGPKGGLIFDQSGNLYGATTTGGSGGGGTVFMLTPSNGSNWTFSVIYSFTGSAYCGSSGSLSMDGAGNLYGTTVCDGANKFGSVFKLTPTSGGWTYTSLHDFSRAEGAGPHGSLVFDTSGNLYGTTQWGGTGGACNGGCGVVFEITP
jgi:uncharacterized repeat protein (TIGR03803 family)